jgi:hypothetical protein
MNVDHPYHFLLGTDSDYENIIYLATQEGSTCSYEDGNVIRNGSYQLERHVKDCPKSKITLFGCSQVKGRFFNVVGPLLMAEIRGHCSQ